MKLTLSLDKDLIEFAHKVARESGDSISGMVASFLRRAQRHSAGYQPDHPLVKKLYGRRRRRPLPDKKILQEKLLRKHLS